MRDVRFTLFLLPLLLVDPLASQRAEEHHGIFSDAIDVTLVNLEIVATDSRGDLVTDLTQDEILVFEDDEPVEISYFTPVVMPLSEATGEITLESSMAAPPEEVAGFVERKHAIILIDNDHLSPASRNSLLTRMRKELSGFMDDDTWVMVVNKNRSVEIERRFTNDYGLVDRALERIQESAQGAALTYAEERIIRIKIESGSTRNPEEALLTALETHSGAHLFAQTVAEQVHHTCEILGYFVDSLSGVPGRKALFYVSDGMPIVPGNLLFRQWWQKYGAEFADEAGMLSPQDTAQEYDTSDAVLGLIADAAANRVAFYPIDTSQDAGSRSVSAAYTSVNAAEQTLALGNADQAAMGLLAKGTGGRSILDPVDVVELMDQVQQDFQSSYELGFVSRFRGDGEIHKVKIETTRKGVQLRYLDRYRSKNSDQLMADRTLAALLLDDATNPLDVKLELGQPTLAEDKKARKKKKQNNPDAFVVPVIVRLPLSNLSLVPEATAHTGNLSLFLVIQDESGHTSPPIKIAVPIKIPHEKLVPSVNQMVGYKTKVRMRAGEQKIAVGVRDDVSQVASTLNLNVNIGDT